MALLTDNTIPKGLALPATRVPGGYFASRSGIDSAWSDLLLAVFTPIGSRAMNREFGSAIYRVLFESTGGDNATILKHAISTAASRWCPHVRLYSVTVLPTKGKTIQIGMEFSLESDAQRQTRFIEIDRDNIKRQLIASSIT